MRPPGMVGCHDASGAPRHLSRRHAGCRFSGGRGNREMRVPAQFASSGVAFRPRRTSPTQAGVQLRVRPLPTAPVRSGNVPDAELTGLGRSLRAPATRARRACAYGSGGRVAFGASVLIDARGVGIVPNPSRALPRLLPARTCEIRHWRWSTRLRRTLECDVPDGPGGYERGVSNCSTRWELKVSSVVVDKHGSHRALPHSHSPRTDPRASWAAHTTRGHAPNACTLWTAELLRIMVRPVCLN